MSLKLHNVLLKIFTLLFCIILLFANLFAINVYAYNPSGYNYHSQLSSRQKEIYNEMKSITPVNRELNVANIYDDYIYPNSPFLSDNDFNSFGSLVATDVIAAADAFLKDYPELFWISYYEYGVGYSMSANKKRPTSVPIKFYISEIYESIINNAISNVNSKISEITASGSTRYDKLKSLHDQLANMIDYVSSATYAHEPYGALIDRKAVCEGYAEAFKLLCDKYNIPCVLVVGEGITSNGSESHMWNYVQMEDGKWYAVDVTWDDQTEKNAKKIFYDYFLVGSNTVATSFGNLKFSQSHIEEGYFSDGSVKRFNYPQLSSTAYNPANPQTPAPTASPTPSSSASTPKPSTPKPSATPSQSDAQKSPGIISNSPAQSPGKTQNPSITPSNDPDISAGTTPDNSTDKNTDKSTDILAPTGNDNIHETPDDTNLFFTPEARPYMIILIILAIVLFIFIVFIIFIILRKRKNN